MPIEIEVLQNGTGLHLIGRGTVTGRDKIEAMERLLASPELLRHLRYMVIDEGVAHVDLSAQDIRTIAELDRRIAQIAPPGIVIAIIAPREVDYGMARMWQILIEETGWETMVFRSFDEADSWLREKVGEWAEVDEQRNRRSA
jgi:hypothetical protein